MIFSIHDGNWAPKLKLFNTDGLIKLIFGKICLNCRKIGYSERFFGHNSKKEHLTALKP